MLRDKKVSALASRLQPAYSKEALEKEIGTMQANIKRIQGAISQEQKGILMKQANIQAFEEAIIREKTNIANFERLIEDINRYERTRH